VVPPAIADEDERRDLAPLTVALRPEDVQLYYQIALIGRRDLPLSSDPRVGFEMTLLRMLAFRRDGASEPPRAGGASQGPGASAGQAPAPSASRDSAQPHGAAGAAPRGPSGDWSALLDALPLQGGARQLAAHCTLQSRDGAVVRLKLDKGHEHLLTSQLQERLRTALEGHFAERVDLRIEIGSPEAETPARRDARLADERLQGAREALERDPNVAALQNELGASFVPDSIEPLR
jgi:DNA polymerase-3 subunit gamma/tau